MNRRPFSIRWFSLRVVIQVLLLGLAIWHFAPTTWKRQLDGGGWPILLVFLGMQLISCFFEWMFHRYILHGRLAGWLSRFSRGHRHHHALTPIKLRPAEVGSDRIILNRYPILEADQYEDAAFPVYALIGFWVFFSPLIIGCQFLMPDWPIVFGGYLSVAWSMFAYEVFHAIEHYPYEWWKRATEHPRWGPLWKQIYGFHHFHHANISTNEAISGFLGLPVADWVFRTYNQPPDLLLDGRMATARVFRIKQPWPWVVWLDRWAKSRESALRRRS